VPQTGHCSNPAPDPARQSTPASLRAPTKIFS
jgi:hypothetical protein